MEGVLKDVKGELVQIDSKWYKAQSPKYIPQKRDIVVEFSTVKEDPLTIKFIKEKVQEAAPAPEVKAEPVVSKPAEAAKPEVKQEKAQPYVKKAYTPYPKKDYGAKAGGYGSPEDVKGKEVGCAIGAAAQILSGSGQTPADILKDMDALVAGILEISKKYKAK